MRVRTGSGDVGRHGMVREVTSQYRSEPATLFGQGLMSTMLQCGLELALGRTRAVCRAEHAHPAAKTRAGKFLLARHTMKPRMLATGILRKRGELGTQRKHP